MRNRILTLGILFLLVFSTIIPISFGYNVKILDNLEQPSLFSIRGKTLYVGGSGDGNYTKIQDAINDASEGDTVFVYDDSSPYIENLTINKGITLLGEDKETTIIDGLKLIYNIIFISADWVTITGFTIQNCNGDYRNGAVVSKLRDIKFLSKNNEINLITVKNLF